MLIASCTGRGGGLQSWWLALVAVAAASPWPVSGQQTSATELAEQASTSAAPPPGLSSPRGPDEQAPFSDQLQDAVQPSAAAAAAATDAAVAAGTAPADREVAAMDTSIGKTGVAVCHSKTRRRF